MTEYLKKHSFPLRSVTDGEDFSDLQPLKEILKGVRIVGLGESTHGTREHFQLKHRITRFLTEEMGFRVFTIEAGMLSCDPIDEYITMGKGDLAEAVTAQGFWTWNTEEVTDMVRWMRSHNLNCPKGEELRFMGYDIQAPQLAYEHLRRILPKMGKRLAEEYLPILEKYENAQPPISDPAPLFKLLGKLKLDEITCSASATRGEYELALRCVRMLCQFTTAMTGPVPQNDPRDRCMADNIMRIMNELPPDAKIIVWAHNGHIAARENWMGGILKSVYGDLYFPFCLTTEGGAFQSRRIQPKAGLTVEEVVSDDQFEIGPLARFEMNHPIPGTFEDLMKDVRKGMYYADLRTAVKEDAETAELFKEPLGAFEVGSAYFEELPVETRKTMLFKYDYSEHFDGVFYLRDTTRARPTKAIMDRFNIPEGENI